MNSDEECKSLNELYEETENIKKSHEEQQTKQNLLNESQKGDLQKSIDLMKSQFDSEKQAFLNDIKKRNEEIANALNLNMQLKEALQNYETELTNMKKDMEELENENEELMEKMEDYNMIKNELNSLKENGGNFQFKQSNRTKMKIQLETLEMENKLLKERISKYEKI